MNKNILSIITVLITIISCSAMIYNSNSSYNKDVEVVNVIKDQQVNIQNNQVNNKINRNKINNDIKNRKSKLSLLDKKKILNLAEKLSSIDYSSIEENLKSDDLEKHKKAIELLKSRFTYSEYKEIKYIENKIS